MIPDEALRREVARAAVTAVLADLDAFSLGLSKWQCPRCHQTVFALDRPPCPAGHNVHLRPLVPASPNARASAPASAEQWLITNGACLRTALATYLAALGPSEVDAIVPEDDEEDLTVDGSVPPQGQPRGARPLDAKRPR